jgi:hypothetical protein
MIEAVLLISIANLILQLVAVWQRHLTYKHHVENTKNGES